MSLSFAEFLVALESDERKLADGGSVAGIAACTSCGTALQESVTGSRPVGAQGCYCSDCYYEELGAGIEAHPLVMPRVHRHA